MANPAAETQFRLVVNPKARLFDQIREVMRFHHQAIRTDKAYTQLIQRFLIFHRQKDRTGPDRGCPGRSAFGDRSASPKLPARDCRRGCCGWDTRAEV